MLVLSRREQETIVIDEQIVIEVTKVSANRVAIGIKAPREVAIRRGELEPCGEESLLRHPISCK